MNTVRYLRFKRNVTGIYGHVYKHGEIIEYHPWPYDWQGMCEQERFEKGIFVHCFGQGEFEVFTPNDVELLEPPSTEK